MIVTKFSVISLSRVIEIRDQMEKATRNKERYWYKVRLI